MITHNIDIIIAQIHARTRTFQQPLKNFYGYLIRQTDLTFRNLGRKGAGEFRGVKWEWFATIKLSDGTQLPPEGRRIRHSFARHRHIGKRPSNHYVQMDSRLLVDSGRLKAAALTTYNITDTTLEADTKVAYAGAQNIDRPFAFITDTDAEKLRQMLIKHITQNDG